MLSKQVQLIEEIKNNHLVKRFRELEALIDENENLKKDY